ncbi:MAG: hypothetical protein ABSE56_03595 [Bryobacteraceae bacterium]
MHYTVYVNPNSDMRTPDVADQSSSKATGSKWSRLTALGGSLWAVHIFQILAIGFGLVAMLDLTRIDLSVPFNFAGDSVFVLSSITAIVRTGWYWSNPVLSAPFVSPVISLPANSSVDYAVAWVVSRFSSAPGLIGNVAWLTFFFLTAITASYCLRQLRIRASISALAGTLYSFLPFAFYRNISHFQLSFYLVPFVCALAIQVSSGERPGKRSLAVLILGSTLLGFNYSYYACFGILSLGVALLIAALRGNARKVALVGLLAIGLIGCATVLNLLPSVVYWHEHGKPYQEYKSIAEVETYGLKISTILRPVLGYTSGPFAALLAGEKSVAFPLENENTMARFGVVLGAGFLVLLACLLGPRWLKADRHGFLASASQLNISLVLVCSVGGLASFFSLLLQTAQIRAYNRAAVFVAFYSAFALAWGAEQWMRRTRHPGWLWATLLCLFVLGMFDQSRAARWLLTRYEGDRATAVALSDTVRQIEGRICSDCMVYQLPTTPFPRDGFHFGMQPYDHGRVQIYSRTLHWSWGPSSLEWQAWEQPLERMQVREMADYLLSSGFSAIWLDRSGYPDGGAQMDLDLTSAAGPARVESRDGRYAVYDLRPLSLSTAYGRRWRKERILNPLVMSWGAGFYPEENSGVDHVTFRWSKAQSAVTVRNPAPFQRSVVFSGRFLSGSPAEVRIQDGHTSVKKKVGPTPSTIDFPLNMAPGETRIIRFSCDGEEERVRSPGDHRELYFYIVGGGVADSALVTIAEAVESKWEGEFSILETKGQENWRWCGNSGVLRLTNKSRDAAWVRLSATVKTSWPQEEKVHVKSAMFADELVTNVNGLEWERVVAVPPGEHLVSFTSNARKHPASGTSDPRVLVFALYDFTLTRVEAPVGRVAPKPVLHRPVEVVWGAGAYPQESGNIGNWHWCSAACEIALVNPSPAPERVRIAMGISTGHAKPARFTITGLGISDIVPAIDSVRPHAYTLDLPPGKNVFKMSCDAPRVLAPGDPRNMVFMVSNLSTNRLSGDAR